MKGSMTTPSGEAREAAADYIKATGPAPRVETIFHAVIREGRVDEHELVQAFHRFQLEERERCAKLAEDFHMTWNDNAVSIATAIRQQGEVK